MSIGDDILSEIIKQGMVRVDGQEPVVFVWSANAADQLSAVVNHSIRRDERKNALANKLAELDEYRRLADESGGTFYHRQADQLLSVIAMNL